jgi:hypothetical protein
MQQQKLREYVVLFGESEREHEPRQRLGDYVAILVMPPS